MSNSFGNPWTVTHHVPLPMGLPRQNARVGCWSGLPFPSPGDLHNPGITTMSSALAGRFFTTEPPGKPKQELGGSEKTVEKIKQDHMTVSPFSNCKVELEKL